ncbi:hypothetical protein GCM10023339_56570 [Alloalcanivorax gelatiniphagus]
MQLLEHHQLRAGGGGLADLVHGTFQIGGRIGAVLLLDDGNAHGGRLLAGVREYFVREYLAREYLAATAW